jgi:hypothetical protein
VKIAVLIQRVAHYRLLGPVIEAAFARGWAVECWHDYSQLTQGLKGYQFPTTDAVPQFLNGVPVIRTYQGPAELTTWLTAMRADVVLAGGFNQLEMPLPTPRPLVVAHQYYIDSLAWAGPEGVLAWDLLVLYSRWWLEWSAGLFEAEGHLVEADQYLQEASARVAYAGLAELDAAASVDPDEVRDRWGIPRGQPVVVLFPFPQGVGRRAFWPRRICGEPSRLRQIAHILAFGRFEYWPDVWHGWNDPRVVAELRRFCDRNGAYLLVKSREKTPVPSYIAAAADRFLYDESHYPATVIEALSIASLSLSYYSNSVFESVALGVPHLCVTFEAKDYNGRDAAYFSRFYTPEEGGAFQFRGVTTAWSIAETLRRLPQMQLADFAMDAEARSRYVRQFLTFEPGGGGARVMDAIEHALVSGEPSRAGARA